MKEQFNTLSDIAGAETLEVLSKANYFNKWMYDQIKDSLFGDILEIGSGIGNISQFAVKDHNNITLSDYNSKYCLILKQKFLNLLEVKSVLQIDLLDPDFETKYDSLKEKFNSIYLLNVIEHIENDNKAVMNINYLLKKKGHIIMLAPAYKWLYSRFDKELGHYRRYTSASLKSLVRNNGFTPISCKYFNAAGIAGWLVFGKILNRKLIGAKQITAFDKLMPLIKLFDKILLNKIGLSVIVKAAKQ